MADLAESAVELVSEYYSDGLSGKRHVVKELILTLTAQGTTTNRITADVLGFTKITDASPAVQSTNAAVLVASPSYDGSVLLLKAAATSAPADFTGTVRVTVTGLTW